MTLQRLARIAIVGALRLAPAALRFPAACALARLVPRHATLGRTQLAAFDDGPAIALYLILWNMTRQGIEYDPSIDVEGDGELEAIRASGRGVLVASGHFGLNHLVIRWLHDHGWRVLTVQAYPIPKFVAGTRAPLTYVTQSPQTLVSVRTALRNGSAVAIDVDSHRPRAGAIPIGPVHVSDHSLRVAERCGAGIVYLETRFAGGRVRARFTPGTREDLTTMFERWTARRRISD